MHEPFRWRNVATHASAARLAELAATRFSRHGRLDHWRNLVEALPRPGATDCALNQDRIRIGRRSDATRRQVERIRKGLTECIPWRKGPFDLFGIHVDTEWRSDWKWQRVLLGPVEWSGACVLDVGCGSGYHLLRALGEEARCAVGIEPTTIFQVQFAVLEHLATPNRWPAVILPARDTDCSNIEWRFDVVLSMGVYYHHRDPVGHLGRLWRWTAPGGWVVLESIVVDDPGGLRPEGRYCRMRNVHHVPSVQQLVQGLERAGFVDVAEIDRSRTTTEEQRSTPWMPWHSLREALDPENPDRTVEGHPAPVRAVVVGRRPG